MARRKENVKLIIAIIAGVIGIASYGAWKDMHPSTEPETNNIFESNYFVHTQAQLDAVPSDKGSVFVDAGKFTISDDGNSITYTPNTIFPKTFAQRDLVVTVEINKLPKNFSPLFDGINKAILPWKEVGSMMNDILLVYDDPNPDLGDLQVFGNGFRSITHQELFIVWQLKRKAIGETKVARNTQANLLKSTRYFVYDIKEAANPKETLTETITRLNKQELPFMLRFDGKPNTDNINMSLFEKSNSMAGFIIPADAAVPAANKP